MSILNITNIVLVTKTLTKQTHKKEELSIIKYTVYSNNDVRALYFYDLMGCMFYWLNTYINCVLYIIQERNYHTDWNSHIQCYIV